MKTILIVDDEPLIRLLFRDAFEDAGYRVLEAEEGGAALEVLARDEVALAILDVRMPGIHGLELLHKVHAQYPQLPVILCTGLKRLFDDFAVWDAGGQVVGLFEKPVDVRVLVGRVGDVLGAPAAATGR